ncbi:MAG: hypothetical protein L0Y58_14615 [Verrucomicrobia subdivision 3 bacterium]|nr:hypothetical protein [Limisphaerales bacterium]
MPQLAKKAGQGQAAEFARDRAIGPRKHPVQDRHNPTSDWTELRGLAWMRSKKARCFDGRVNLSQGYPRRRAAEAGAAAGAAFRGDEARGTEIQEQTADHDRMGVNGAGQHRRGAEVTLARGEDGHHMNGKGKAAALSHGQ